MIRGKAHVFGDDVNTDEIIPARYLNRIDPAFLGAHCMEDADPEFVGKLEPGDVIVAGKNFGCGSSREHAPLAIKAAGVACVVARSFARIFFRNAINIGLPLLECEEAVDNIEAGNIVEVELSSGNIKNLTSGREFTARPYPDFMAELIAAGGLIEHTKQILAGRRT